MFTDTGRLRIGALRPTVKSETFYFLLWHGGAPPVNRRFDLDRSRLISIASSGYALS